MKKLFFVTLAIVSVLVSNVYAANQKKAARPANVVVEKSTGGKLAPTTLFVGTVRFSDISSVAAESSGKVRQVKFEEGDTVSKGSVLAVIDSELLNKSLEEEEAGMARIEANLQLAKNDFERTEKLFRNNATSEQDYDNRKYSAIALEKEKAAQLAAISNLKAQLQKKIIYAPFDGVVVSKDVSPGEWASEGTVAAQIAKTGVMEIYVNVPERIIGFLNKGAVYGTTVAGRDITAVFSSVIPVGDTSNRTFPVKLSTSQSKGLLEGMEAKVNLPSSTPADVIFVNRDAVVKARGNVFVYTVAENAAKPIPVKVVGYDGNRAGVLSPHLKPGMVVITKGNERIRPDQPVNIIGK